MANPVPNYSITTPFGRRGRHWSCRKDSSGQGIHTGADWAAPSGTPIVAPIAGTIRHRSYGSAFGPNQFAISPSAGQPFASGEVFFAHTLDRLPDGTEVQVGQQIARVGALGNATGAHLHMEYMPNTKNRWDCTVHADPAPVVNHGGGGGGGGGGGTPITTDIYSNKLGYGEPTNGDDSSDTVKELQRRLNGIKLVGGTNLPITGKYHDMTDAEVRKWQEQVCGDAPDAAGRSFLGPAQRARMFPSPPYTVHDRGLPAVAGGTVGPAGPGPGAGAGDPGGGAWVPGNAWFAAPSLLALKAEVDSRWPNRSTASDGTIGDAAHATSKSEHNPVGHQFGPQFGTPGCVHAIDITVVGADYEAILGAVLRDPRVWYVIHKGSIWSKTYGWEQRPYSGDPHTDHIHVSLAADDQASALAHEADTGAWFDQAPPPVQPPAGDGGYITRDEYRKDLGAIAEAVRKAGEA